MAETAAAPGPPLGARVRRNTTRTLQIVFVAFVGAILYGPVIILGVFSFNDSISVSLPLNGFTVRWYQEALRDPNLHAAIRNSLVVAAIVTPVCVVLGTLSAYALTRLRFWGRSPSAGLIAAPLVIPWLVIGIAGLLFFDRVSLPVVGELPLSLWTITIMQIVCTFPLVTAVISARLARFERRQEEAAIDLGASQMQMLRYVILPQLYPALAASAIFAFSWSFNNFEISYFVGGFQQTFPVWVYSTLLHAISLPSVNAISTLISVMQVLLICLAWRMLKPRGGKLEAADIVPMGSAAPTR